MVGILKDAYSIVSYVYNGVIDEVVYALANYTGCATASAPSPTATA